MSIRSAAGINWSSMIRCAALLLLSLISAGCAYRLGVASPPQIHRIRILTIGDAAISVRVGDKDFSEREDGAIAFQVPGGGRRCDVYLFDVIPIPQVPDKSEELPIVLISNGLELRRWSLREFLKLPTDSDGARVLKLY